MIRVLSNRILVEVIALLAPVILAGGLLLILDFGLTTVAAAPNELFISEYIEGSGNNKALEIFNGTGTNIDLATTTYDLQIFFNGSLTASVTIALTGTVSSGDVFVFAHSSADPAILAQADQTSGNNLFNGNDAIALRKSGVIIDVIGQIGVDPGTAWGSAPTRTQDQTLRRKFSIETGDTDGGDPFDPTLEWLGFANDTFDGLGAHAISPPPLTIVINEVAWGGTAASATDEWLELFNTTAQTIALTGWVITSTNGLNIPLDGGTIGPNGYYLIERTDDNTISDIAADQIAPFGSLANGGDRLYLSRNGIVIDTANGNGGSWPGGSGSPDFTSMERIDPTTPDSDTNWGSNSTLIHNGQDANGNPINGTPKQPNSTGVPPPPPPPTLLAVVINEAAWGGTLASATDEWLELLNTTPQTVTLDGWVITSTNGLNIPLSGSIGPNGYYLIERTDDTSVSDITADLFASFGSGLANGGDGLFLSTGGILIDTANGDGGVWPAGTGSPGYLSMERIDPGAPDTDTNWAGNDTINRNGQDANSGAINGTPKQLNSTQVPPPPPPALTIVINEVAWGGTLANTADEWIELLNTTTQTLSLDSWLITGTNGLNIPLDGTTIGPNGYYLIERTDDNTVSDVGADLTIGFGSGLVNGGDTLFLSKDGAIIDTANIDSGPWPGGTGSPNYLSMERIDPALPDADANWSSNDTLTRNGQDAAGNPINGTPKQPNSVFVPPPPPPPPVKVLISEFVYDGTTPSTEGDEFVELCNPNLTSVDLTGYKVGDEEIRGGGESMYQLPISTTLAANACLIVAKNADQFAARFGMLSDYEVIVTGASFTDNLNVPNLIKYTAWGSGSWSLSNTGDELVVLGPNDEILDSVAYRNGDYAGLGLEPDASAPEPKSLQRVWPIDTDSMPHDFVHTDPTPGLRTEPPAGLAFAPPANLPGGMKAFWGHLHAHTSYSDGSGPPYYALALAQAAGLHFYAITDHGWWLTDQEWAATLSQTLAATIPGQFVALRGVEWTHDTVGHINIFNTNTLLRRTDPLFDELGDVYTWLAANPTAIAQFNHPDPNYGGTFLDFAYHPAAAQMLFLQEIGNNAQRYTTYEPSFVQSNAVGWRVAPTINGDTHTALWGTDIQARTGIVAPALTEADLLDALRARRVFATEDRNLALTLRLDGAWMGSVLTASGTLPLIIDFVDPDPEPLTIFIYDGSLLVASQAFSASTGQWNLAIEALPGHYYWAKVVQADGDRAYSAPIWLDGQPPVDRLYINEILPAPQDWDWDGNGVADHTDEWIELYNPMDRPLGLGGWRLADSSGIVYSIPLGVTIPPGGRLTFYQAQTGFSLNNGGDTVTLTHPNGTVIDRMSYDHNPGYDETWCRLPDGGPTWSDRCGPSPNDANWEIPPRAPLTVTIYEAKRLTYGAWVRVKGRVTAPPGVLGRRQMVIQDETAGILIYLPKDHGLTLNLGDKVELVGNLRTIYEEFEIAVDEPGDVDFIKSDAPPPPLPVATTSLLEPYEGRLVMLQGQAVQFRGRTTLWIDDGTGWAKIYIRASTGIKKPFIETGTPLTVVGIASQHSSSGNPTRDDYQLLPRYQSDLMLPDQAPVPAGWPTLLPETGQ